MFKRHNDDILLSIPVSFTQATLGDNVDVPTIYGDVSLKIPAGTQSGTVLRIKGRGVSNVNSNRKGDQLVTINIETPTNLSKEQIEALKKFDKLEKKETPLNKFKKLFKN